MNVILLSRNMQSYVSGIYHQDIVNSFIKLTNAYVYGPGYKDYNKSDNFKDVIKKSSFNIDNLDLIVCTTSWDDDESLINVNPHHNINLSNIKNIKKIYFLNKEYKKLDYKFKYIKNQKFDLVCTVLQNTNNWSKELGIKFLNVPFGVSLEKFKDLKLKRKYDFAFTGSLHRNHLDERFKVKNILFKANKIGLKSNKGLSGFCNLNPLNINFQKKNIFWAEWGAKSFFLKSLLPSGEEYVKLLNQSKVFLNTTSAMDIFNTRFFELMATKTMIICPESDNYLGILKDRYNCLMYRNDMSNFTEIFLKAIDDVSLRKQIVLNAFNDIEFHSYDYRIKSLLKMLKSYHLS